LIVEPIKKEKKTQSGLLYVPENAIEKPVYGRIVAVAHDVPEPFKVDVLVLYGAYGGREITVSGETYLLLRTEEIDAVVADAEFAETLYTRE